MCCCSTGGDDAAGPRPDGRPSWRTGRCCCGPYRRGDARAWSEVRVRQPGVAGARGSPRRPDRGHELNSPRAYRVRLPRHAAGRAARREHAVRGLPARGRRRERLVGHLNLGNIVRRAFCSAYAGYWVDSRVAGRGVIPTALALAVDHAFGAGGLHRIEVNIRPENKPSPAGGGEARLPRGGVPPALHAHRRRLARPHRIRDDQRGGRRRGRPAGPLAPAARPAHVNDRRGSSRPARRADFRSSRP